MSLLVSISCNFLCVNTFSVLSLEPQPPSWWSPSLHIGGPLCIQCASHLCVECVARPCMLCDFKRQVWRCSLGNWRCCAHRSDDVNASSPAHTPARLPGRQRPLLRQQSSPPVPTGHDSSSPQAPSTGGLRRRRLRAPVWARLSPALLHSITISISLFLTILQSLLS